MGWEWGVEFFMGGSLEDCFTLPGSYFPSWVFLPDSCWLGRTAQSTDFQHSDSSRVFLLIAAPCGNGGQVHPMPKLFQLSFVCFLSLKARTPWSACFPLAWVLSRFNLLKLKSLFNGFMVEPWSDPLSRERPWDRRTDWWCRKRTSVDLSEYYPGLFVLCWY